MVTVYGITPFPYMLVIWIWFFVNFFDVMAIGIPVHTPQTLPRPPIYNEATASTLRHKFLAGIDGPTQQQAKESLASRNQRKSYLNQDSIFGKRDDSDHWDAATYKGEELLRAMVKSRGLRRDAEPPQFTLDESYEIATESDLEYCPERAQVYLGKTGWWSLLQTPYESYLKMRVEFGEEPPALAYLMASKPDGHLVVYWHGPGGGWTRRQASYSALEIDYGSLMREAWTIAPSYDDAPSAASLRYVTLTELRNPDTIWILETILSMLSLEEYESALIYPPKESDRDGIQYQMWTALLGTPEIGAIQQMLNLYPYQFGFSSISLIEFQLSDISSKRKKITEANVLVSLNVQKLDSPSVRVSLGAIKAIRRAYAQKEAQINKALVIKMLSEQSDGPSTDEDLIENEFSATLEFHAVQQLIASYPRRWGFTAYSAIRSIDIGPRGRSYAMMIRLERNSGHMDLELGFEQDSVGRNTFAETDIHKPDKAAANRIIDTLLAGIQLRIDTLRGPLSRLEFEEPSSYSFSYPIEMAQNAARQLILMWTFVVRDIDSFEEYLEQDEGAPSQAIPHMHLEDEETIYYEIAVTDAANYRQLDLAISITAGYVVILSPLEPNEDGKYDPENSISLKDSLFQIIAKLTRESGAAPFEYFFFLHTSIRTRNLLMEIFNLENWSLREAVQLNAVDIFVPDNEGGYSETRLQQQRAFLLLHGIPEIAAIAEMTVQFAESPYMDHRVIHSIVIRWAVGEGGWTGFRIFVTLGPWPPRNGFPGSDIVSWLRREQMTDIVSQGKFLADVSAYVIPLAIRLGVSINRGALSTHDAEALLADWEVAGPAGVIAKSTGWDYHRMNDDEIAAAPEELRAVYQLHRAGYSGASNDRALIKSLLGLDQITDSYYYGTADMVGFGSNPRGDLEWPPDEAEDATLHVRQNP
ncbi:hypothetical protein TWF696_006728 [Orbilia brochopaga]|uniref:Uncharacterized protein n=1 Tax=Orbilia brochopaga TaxID=3140254 RepID=A0AAV9UTE3_9PEZI